MKCWPFISLVVACRSDEPPKPAPAPKPTYDEFHEALLVSQSLSGECIAVVCGGFQETPTQPPTDRAALKDAVVFEVPLAIDGHVANCEPESMLPIHELQDAGVSAHVDHDSICRIHDRIDGLGMWPDKGREAIAMLRAPKHPPKVVVFYSRWCDHSLGYEGAYTCKVGLTWMTFPERVIIASAFGTGHGDYVAAMHGAEAEVTSIVRAW